MTLTCPNCNSTQIARRERGKRTGATIGMLTGAAVGAASVLRGAQVGMVLGAAAGPVGIVTGGLSGALLASLVAGSAGCAIGSAAGSIADNTFLNNRCCMACGCTFREDVENPIAPIAQFADLHNGPAANTPPSHHSNGHSA